MRTTEVSQELGATADAKSPRRVKKARKPPIEAEVRLLDWGPRGAVRADIDGRGVLVDRGIPGETVMAMVDRRRKPWHGIVDSVLTASPDRVATPCPYLSAGCGGCQWQHVSYDAQLRIKEELVNREMQVAGAGCLVERVWGMDAPWRYRHTAAIAIGWEAGFRPRGRRGIVEIHDCLIAHPLIGRLADQLNQVLRAGSIPNYHGKVWLDCTVVGSEFAPTMQIVIQGIDGLTLEAHPELLRVAADIAGLDGVGTIAFRHRSGAVHPLVGELMSTIEVAGRPMWLPAGSFFQTNPRMLCRLLDRMRTHVGDRMIGEAADIYGGVGTLGLNLADLTTHMTLVELDEQAVEAARRTAEAWGLDHIAFVSRHAERALPDMRSLDLAIVDPPRSGLGDVVIDALDQNGVHTIMYVSCSPQSFTRDLSAFLQAGYRVESFEIFDFYPQTYHVESLAVLAR